MAANANSTGHGLVARMSRARQQITDLTFDPQLSRSYWPEEPRKSRSRVLGELLWWMLRSGEVNNYYYVYGLDRKSAQRIDLMPYRAFRRLRNKGNLRTGTAKYNYVCLLQDKFLFSQLASSLGIPTPKSIAMLDADAITWLDRNETLPLESIVDPQLPMLDGFCKKFDGIQGDGAFPLQAHAGELRVAGEPISIDALRQRLDGRFLFQQRIVQHPALAALHPASVNTLRLISFCNAGRATVAFGALRVGTGSSNVDNWAAGGIIIGIDLERGELRDDGFFKPGYGGRVRAHPDSGIRFEGFQIPQFDRAMTLVTRLHEFIPQVHSVGWDVAISAEGPVIIEGNDDWEGGIPMVLEHDFKQRFLAMCEPASRRPS
ncbi:MAG: sugar-transfer associated ATP-grasp domain-containing protein [Luteimonas sp.]